jgi:hypothetical protein
MWFSIPGESCQVGWNDDGSDDDDDDDDEAGGGDSGSGGATSLVGGLSVDSDAMVALRFGMICTFVVLVWYLGEIAGRCWREMAGRSGAKWRELLLCL